MIFKLRNLFVMATALTAVNVATKSEAASPNSFDTVVFLRACSDLVPNVDYALPMDAECIGQSHRMCELADPSAEAERCVSVVSNWMRDETISEWSQIPERKRLGYDPPPAAQDEIRDAKIIFDNDVLEQFAPAITDCEDIQIEGVSDQVACGYADALAGRLTLRILQRAAERAEEKQVP
ncbi:hypothetical protein [Ruegeria arenilitoris]|uniref:hypothetical protein n=1 Tax=Ruegeria arenilitoris TaxID=1173585 RepID=UPI00147DF99D|nr:hypothetical protein [Ruegeria arenilitoris]